MNTYLEHQLTIDKYDGQLPLVNKILDLIETKYSEVFYAVITHGSVATNEVVPYSDFDGLLVVNDQYVNSKKIKAFKKESMKAILNFDPLQHHGWFQIAKIDLLNYPENYLPISTLKYSKLIYPRTSNFDLHIKLRGDINYKSTLENMLNLFEKRDIENWKPKNSYQLKSVLSQVMLIPCLYFSAINNDGIFKRESFKAVKSSFTESEWMPIEIATHIRTNWNYNMSGFQKLLLSQQSEFIRKIATRFLAPKIQSNIQKKLDDAFYSNLMLMVKKIKKDIV